MKNEESFVKVPHSLLEWKWFHDEKTLQFYMYLRLNVRHSEGYSQGHKVTRGQVLIKCEKIENELGISKQTLRTLITRLISTHKITREKVLNKSLFTVIDYDLEEKPTHDLTHSQHTANTRLTHTLINKNDKNDKKEKLDINTETRNIKKEIKKFVPPSQEEVRAYCKERNRGVDPDKWWDFYQSKGWKVGQNKMVDWKAAVRTWEHNKPATQQRDYGEEGIQKWD